MINLIQADIYRMRKGKGMLGVLIGVTAIILVTCMIARYATTDAFITSVTSASSLMTEAELLEVQADMQTIKQYGSMDLINELLFSNMLIFFILPFAVMLFSNDFGSGAIRNLITHNDKRVSIYLSKFVLCVGCVIFLNVFTFLVTVLFAGIAFGFTGITAAALGQAVLGMLMIMLGHLAAISFALMMTAIGKKSSVTITVYFIMIVALSLIASILVTFTHVPQFEMIDLLNSAQQMYNPSLAAASDLIFYAAFAVIMTTITTLIGASVFKNSDITN